jgi:hypothetical protein
MTDFDRIDFSPLDPAANPVRWEAMVGAIMARAALPVPRGPLMMVAAWSRPTLALAASIAALSLVALRSGTAEPQPALAGGVVEALDVPAPVADWIDEERGPREGDLLVALDEMPDLEANPVRRNP